MQSQGYSHPLEPNQHTVQLLLTAYFITIIMDIYDFISVISIFLTSVSVIRGAFSFVQLIF